MEYTVMKLHEDTEVFDELISVTADKLGLPQVYVEKDYWVTKALRYLSESDHADVAVFKGGTSLSKAYRLIARFSEDIDLAIFSKGKGDSARKKLLKSVEKVAATGLVCVKDDARQQKGSKYRKTVYQYPRHVAGEYFGQATPKLILEVNAFTEPEPFELKELQTMIAEALTSIGKEDLIKSYALESFSINVLSVKRTLVEKILRAIKDSYAIDPEARLADKIRHLYDICLILRKDEHREFVLSDDFTPLCELCIEGEKNGIFDGSEFLEKPLTEAPLFSRFSEWKGSLEKTYQGIFADLVYGEIPSLDEVEETLLFIHSNI